MGRDRGFAEKYSALSILNFTNENGFGCRVDVHTYKLAVSTRFDPETGRYNTAVYRYNRNTNSEHYPPRPLMEFGFFNGEESEKKAKSQNSRLWRHIMKKCSGLKPRITGVTEGLRI